MKAEIANNRLKIHLRSASYSKRFNFISPISKNNDRPIEFTTKFKVKQELINQLEEILREIDEEK